MRLIKPQPIKISDDTIYVCGNGPAQFVVSNTITSHYKWLYNASQVQSASNNNSSILQLNYNGPGTYNVGVVEFNEILCASDTLNFVVIVHPTPSADFTYAIANSYDVNFTNTNSNATSYDWNFGDGAQSTDPNPSHTYASNGTYNVKLVATNQFGCVDTIVKTVTINQLGLAINTANAAIQIYPNPVTDILFISNTDMEKVSIQVMDINGRVIYNTNEYTNSSMIEIPTQTWNKGMYFVTVSSENGQQANMKLIRE